MVVKVCAGGALDVATLIAIATAAGKDNDAYTSLFKLFSFAAEKFQA